MTISRAVPQAMSEIFTLAQHYANDTSRTNPRFSDVEYLRHGNEVAKEIQTLRGLASPEALIASFSATYPADSETLVLTASIGHRSPFRVQDLNNPRSPVDIPIVAFSELDTPRRSARPDAGAALPRRCTVIATIATPQVPDFTLMIWPRPSAALTLRIYAVANALIAGADTDLSPLQPEWTTLMASGIAIQLRGPHSEGSEEVYRIYEDHKKLFIEACRVRRGPRRVKNQRRNV